jgi:cysteine desulfurase family protein (TIGR01976 family)
MSNPLDRRATPRDAGPDAPMVFARARDRFAALRGDFVFLDAPGGTQVPDEVGDAVARVYREASGNTGAPYATSQRIEALVLQARADTARFLGCDSDEVIFGGSMTALSFMLSRTFGRRLRPGDEIVVTRLDHDGNVAPWLDLAHDLGLRVRQADVHADTTLDLHDLERQLGARTRVVAFPWAANSVGTIVDARAVTDLAHRAGALAWVDAVQYAPHEPMDVRAIGADILLCSAYKFCGPHLGIAFGRRELLESWQPYKARPVPMQPAGHAFETGTVPYELLGGLVAAFAYTESLGGMARIAAWERQLSDRLLAGLPPAATLYGLPTSAGRVPTFLVNFDGIPSAWLSAELANRGFGVWSHGSYYALGLHDRIGWGEALRIGLAHYNTMDEVDRFNEVLGALVGGRRTRKTTAHVRLLLDTSGSPDGHSDGAPGLVRRIVDVPPQAQFDGDTGDAGELWFVLGGTGWLSAADHPSLLLSSDQGLLMPPGVRYRLTGDATVGLRLDAVTLPAGGSADLPAGGTGPTVRDVGDCEVETTGDRRFRVLFGPGRGCDVATQFVGEIPPGRAPEHSHPYDEVVLILEGEGIAHVGDADHALPPHVLSVGSCIHLPPGQLHCLENTGAGVLRVLGVFHPADTPAAKLPAPQPGPAGGP